MIYALLAFAAYIAMQSEMIVGLAMVLAIIGGILTGIAILVALIRTDDYGSGTFEENLKEVPYKRFVLTMTFIAMLVVALFPSKQTMLAVVVVPFAAVKGVELVEYFKGPVGEYLDLLLKSQIEEMKQQMAPKESATKT